MITSVSGDDRTTVLELQPLGPDDVARVLADVLGGPVEPGTVSAFYERSAGGALFLRELVGDARRSGSLRREAGAWAVRRDWTPGMQLLDLVHARLRRDDEDESLALEIVAVGEPVSLGILLALVADTAAARLEQDGLLEVRRDGRRRVVAFAHPLYGEATRARLTSLAARRHRLRLADAMSETGARRRGDLMAIALWRLDGGDLDPDEWLLAAQRALALRHHAAAALAERAVNASATATAWTVLGEARTVERDLEGAMAAFVAARAAAETDRDLATVAAARAKSAFWVGQQVEGVVEELEAAETALRDGASRALLAAQRVSILVNSGRTREGVTLADQVVSEGLVEPAARRWVQLVAANGLAFLGETRRARSIAEALMAEPEPSPSTHIATGSAATSLIIAELLGGNVRRADDLLQLADGLVQDPENAGFVAALHGRVALWQGKPRTAIGRLERGRDGLAAGMSPWRSAWCDALRVEAAALVGLPSQPVQLVLGPTNEIAHRFLALDTLRSEATRMATTGDLPGACVLARDAADQAIAHELLAAALLGQYERFRLRDPDAVSALLALADRVDGSWSAMCAAHVRAWETGDAAALEAAAAQFADAGMLLYAAECATDAATTSERAGKATAARRASAWAHELRVCARTVGVRASGRSPARRRSPPGSARSPSWPRAGLSNRDIADRLTVGVRTVEGHLLRIYAKVGVRSRRELARRLRLQPTTELTARGQLAARPQPATELFGRPSPDVHRSATRRPLDLPRFAAMRTIDDDDEIANTSDNETFAEVLEARLSRRSVLTGGAAALATGVAFSGADALVSAVPAAADGRRRGPLLGFDGIDPFADDTVHVPPGYTARVLISWGDPVSNGPAFKPDASNTAAEQAQQWGMHNDGVVFFPIEGILGRFLPLPFLNSWHGVLVENSEYTDDGLLFPDFTANWTAEKTAKSQNAHGVNIVEVRRRIFGNWEVVRPSRYARRITAQTPIDFGGPIAGDDRLKTAADPTGRRVLGTLNNCAMGFTPWGTYLACEENFNGYFLRTAALRSPSEIRYGIAPFTSGQRWGTTDTRFNADLNPNEPNRFGWVTEIDPFNPNSTPVKRTALGRLKHEGAWVQEARDGRVVVYMGDDQTFEYIYRYVSADRWRRMRRRGVNPLDEGTLYVARFKADGTGEWLPLVPGAPGLPAADWPLARILVDTRLAADAVRSADGVGTATKMDRPEWIDTFPDQLTGIVTLTNNTARTAAQVDAATPTDQQPRRNPYGHILRWFYANDFTEPTFGWDIFALGGNPVTAADGTPLTADHFGSPDGLYVAPSGRLWIQTDVSASTINAGLYAGFGNNQMLCADPGTREIRRFLTGPNGCEVTGCFTTPDERTMFVGIQHPGEPASGDVSATNPATSTWPTSTPGARPRSSCIVITKNNGGEIGS